MVKHRTVTPGIMGSNPIPVKANVSCVVITVKIHAAINPGTVGELIVVRFRHCGVRARGGQKLYLGADGYHRSVSLNITDQTDTNSKLIHI